MGEQFTLQELAMLMEACDAWASEPIEKGLSSALMGAMIEKDQEKSLTNMKSQMKKATDEKKIRSERSTLLKAKLIRMRDGVAAASLAG